MSPPIYTPDGSEVSEIVLPDGSTASQVIDPDGNVVFEAGPDIPDIEDYESGDLSSWSNTANFSVQQTTVFEGDYAVELTGRSEFDVMTFDDPDSVVAGQGQSIQYRCYIPSGSIAYGSHTFGVQNSSSDYYTIRLDPSDSRVIKVKNGSSSGDVTQSEAGCPEDEWLRVVRRWFNGTEDGRSQGEMEVEVFDSSDTSIFTLTGTDTEYTSDMIGLDKTFGRQWFVDKIVAGETK